MKKSGDLENIDLSSKEEHLQQFSERRMKECIKACDDYLTDIKVIIAEQLKLNKREALINWAEDLHIKEGTIEQVKNEVLKKLLEAIQVTFTTDLSGKNKTKNAQTFNVTFTAEEKDPDLAREERARNSISQPASVFSPDISDLENKNKQALMATVPPSSQKHLRAYTPKQTIDFKAVAKNLSGGAKITIAQYKEVDSAKKLLLAEGHHANAIDTFHSKIQQAKPLLMKENTSFATKLLSTIRKIISLPAAVFGQLPFFEKSRGEAFAKKVGVIHEKSLEDDGKAKRVKPRK